MVRDHNALFAKDLLDLHHNGILQADVECSPLRKGESSLGSEHIFDRKSSVLMYCLVDAPICWEGNFFIDRLHLHPSLTQVDRLTVRQLRHG